MALEAAASKIRRWRHDPVAFVRENFDIEPDDWQAEFLINYNDNNRTGAKACKGPGKTAVLAWCAWHFLATRPHPKIAATSITGDNLRDGLWTEMSKWQQRSSYLKAAFTWKAERITCNDHPETWWMAARRWSKDAAGEKQADTLAGLHADYILFIIDEAGGVPDAVMAAAEAALATGIECKILICGNPTHLSGPLWRACTSEASMWKMVEITGDPDNPKRSKRISVTWAREQIKKYGADNPWVLVNVFGKFPPASLNALLGPDDVEAAMSRVIRPEAYNFAAKVLGVDVARHGDDRTVIAPRQGLAAFKPVIMRNPDMMQVAGAVAQAINKWEPDAVFVDATGGWGWGVIDRLNELGYEVVGVEFSGKADSRQYFNKRAEMSFQLAHWVKHGGCLPPDRELKEECCAMTYCFKGDRMQLSDKDQIKEDLGRSPDLFDAYMLTFAYPVAKKNRNPHAQKRAAVAQSEYHPVTGRMEVPQQNVDDYNPLG